MRVSDLTYVSQHGRTSLLNPSTPRWTCKYQGNASREACWSGHPRPDSPRDRFLAASDERESSSNSAGRWPNRKRLPSFKRARSRSHGLAADADRVRRSVTVAWHPVTLDVTVRNARGLICAGRSRLIESGFSVCSRSSRARGEGRRPSLHRPMVTRRSRRSRRPSALDVVLPHPAVERRPGDVQRVRRERDVPRRRRRQRAQQCLALVWLLSAVRGDGGLRFSVA